MHTNDEMHSFAKFLAALATGAGWIACLSFLFAASIRPDLVAARLIEVFL